VERASLLHSQAFWAYGALIVFPVLLYLNTLRSDFVFDDLPLLVEHSKVRELSTPWRLFVGQPSGRPTYRMVRTISYALDYAIGGMEPTVYHFSNILYHTITALLVFRLVRRLTVAWRAALFASLLFAAHPIQTEAVAYISGRRDLLSTLFYLVGLLSFVRYRDEPNRRHLLVARGAFLLAVLSKEMAITLPFLWLAYDTFRGLEPSPSAPVSSLARQVGAALKAAVLRSRALYGSMLAACAAMSVYFLFVITISRQKAFYGGSLATTLLTLARIVAHYVKLLLFPATLSADYSYNAFPVTNSWGDLRAWLAVFALGLILFGLLKLAAHAKMAAFGGLWFFLTLLPVSQIIPHHELMAEHYLYLPSIGIAIMAGVLLDRWTERSGRAHAVYAGFAVLLLLFSLRTIVRNRDWKDEFTLWKKTVQTAPDSGRAHLNLALFYLDTGKYALAEHEFNQTTRITPDDVHLLISMGLLKSYTWNLEEADRYFREAVRIGARTKRSLAAVALNNLGAIALGRGGHQEAERYFQEASQMAPGLLKSWLNLAQLHMGQGRYEETETELQKVVQARPDLRLPHLMLAQIFLTRGLLDQAEREALKALHHAPSRLPRGAYSLIGQDPVAKQQGGTAGAHGLLAQVYLARGQLNLADTEAKEALRLQPGQAAAHGILAQAYAARGMLAEAEAEAKEALRLQQSRPGPSFGPRQAEGRPQGAQGILGRDDPAAAPYHYVLGVIYQRRGKTAEAAQQMRTALRLNPNFGAAREALKALGAKKSSP